MPSEYPPWATLTFRYLVSEKMPVKIMKIFVEDARHTVGTNKFWTIVLIILGKEVRSITDA